jgi:hypothetical protein
MMTGEPAGVVLLKAPQSVWSQLSGADCGVTADAVSRAFLSVVAGSWETLTTHRARWYRDVRG